MINEKIFRSVSGDLNSTEKKILRMSIILLKKKIKDKNQNGNGN
jgi:hypothetical protein